MTYSGNLTRFIHSGLAMALVVVGLSFASSAEARSHHKHHHHHVHKHARPHPHHVKPKHHHAVKVVPATKPAPKAFLFGSPVSKTKDMVSIASRYIGSSGRQIGMKSRAWCAEFANLVRVKAGYRSSGSNLAKQQVRNAKKVRPAPGTIAIMNRRGGGHTCIVTRVSADTIQCISGNGRHKRVSYSTYPRHRIIAYLLPT